ncbi:hypothetical protein DC498_12420 [Terrimonas sp.]|uniref:DUF5995 family protein n=1 Tax=Terrimonas sp. TaxID=1914338 RepID=UPI000D50FF8A|nr:DUF5995 family protein [Terrimonas sp.]PVD51850.1 hypothetical protein DC498_12420 [Terrimonas sp.]
MPIQNIAEVITRLDAIVQQTKTEKSCFGYFAALYKRMTIAVDEGIKHNLFEDGSRMDRLDVVFAQRYIDAYEAYKAGGQCTSSWKFVFDNCSNNDLTVVQHILLGVNTHINLDLAIATAEMADKNGIDALQNDFNKINDVIATLIDDVQECLSQVWLPMRLLDKIVSGRHVPVLNFSIDKARTASWSSALILAGLNTEQKQFYINQMDTVVLRVCQGIASPGLLTGMMLKAIRTTEYDDAARTINLIDTTIVD